MEIHSSSLNFRPSGNPLSQKRNLADSAKTTSGSGNSSRSSRRSRFQSDKLPKDLRIAKAINAYLQESAEALKNSQSELISGVDVFV